MSAQCFNAPFSKMHFVSEHESQPPNYLTAWRRWRCWWPQPLICISTHNFTNFDKIRNFKRIIYLYFVYAFRSKWIHSTDWIYMHVSCAFTLNLFIFTMQCTIWSTKNASFISHNNNNNNNSSNNNDIN